MKKAKSFARSFSSVVVSFVCTCLLLGTALTTIADTAFASQDFIWTSKNDMQFPKWQAACGVIDNKIYTAGGSRPDGAAYDYAIWEYNPLLETWTSKANLNLALCGPAVGVVNNKMYVMGGHTGAWRAELEEYDPATNTVSIKASMSMGRDGLAASVVNNKIYAIGGGIPGGVTNKVEEYDPLTNTWVTKANMPTPRACATACAYNGKIYVVGGYNYSEVFATVEVFDPIANTWTTKASMPYGRYVHNAVEKDGKVYVIGGQAAPVSGGAVLDSVLEYDIANDTWTQKESIQYKRVGMVSAVANDKVYVIGGLDGSGAPIKSIEEGTLTNTATQYTFLKKFGGSGDGNGQFREALGIDFDSTGKVFVASKWNGCIQIFTPGGDFISRWDIVDLPIFLKIDSADNVYVTIYGGLVKKYSSNGTLLNTWGGTGSGDGQFARGDSNSPRGMAIDSSGNIYIADSYNHRIQKFSSTGAFLGKWGSYGSGDGQLNCPGGIAIDNAGNIYVVEILGNRVQKFTPDGTFLAKYGSQGSGDGQFNNPNGIAIDKDGYIYVADTANECLKKYDSNMNFIVSWGSSGAGDGQFGGLFEVAVADNGNVYTTEWANSRVQVFASGLSVAPIANAGSNKTFHLGDTVTLDGSASSDPGGNLPLIYSWTIKTRPQGSVAQLSNPSSVITTFQPDVLGNYIIELVVTNSLGQASALSQVTVKPAMLIVPDNYATIQQAIDAANHGDTVWVRKGTYHEHLTINKSITLSGEDRDATVIDGSGTGNVIFLNSVANVIISSLTIQNGNFGVELSNSNNNTLDSCKITLNNGTPYGGVYFQNRSLNNTITNCEISSNNCSGIDLHDDGETNNNIVNNKIFSNGTNGVIGYAGSNATLVKGNEIYNNLGSGIICGWSTWSGIEDNKIYSNAGAGIVLDTAQGNTVKNNIIHGNGLGMDLGGWGPDYNTISNNEIYSNNNGGISFNTDVKYNTFVGNWIHDNNNFGIYIGKSDNHPHYSNTFYQNDFINNAVNALILEDRYSNTWDNGYPSGGNYWSDYSGSDQFSGESQNIPGSDGIGDTAYVMNALNKDRYPSMQPFQSSSGAVIFDDQFTESTLSPGWVINPGNGSYSLTDNPGYLRHIIDANHTGRDGSSGYAKALWLVRPFSGKQWVLRTSITYNLRPSDPTNNNNAHFVIREPADNGAVMARIDRSVGLNDGNPGSNYLSLGIGTDNQSIFLPNSPNSLPPDKWYIEIDRDNDRFTIKVSTSADYATFEYVDDYTYPQGTFGNDQAIEIEGDGWYGSNDPAGYEDFDYITVRQSFGNANLIANAGFEDGVYVDEASAPACWTRSGAGLQLWKNDAQQHGGVKCIGAGSGAAGDYACWSQSINGVVPGTVFKFSAWLMTEDLGAPAGKLQVEFRDGSNTLLKADTLDLALSQNMGWTQYNLQTNSAPDGTTQAKFVLMGANGAVQFDDVSATVLGICRNGLIAYYPFNDNANDATGNGHNGIVNGATFTTDRFGNIYSAYSFDGAANHYISVPDNDLWNFRGNSFAISLWTNLANNTARQCFISQDEGGGSLNKWFFAYDGSVNFHVNSPSGPSIWLSFDTTLTPNEWTHLALVRNGNEWQLYKNGVLAKTVINSIVIPDVNFPIWMGNGENWGILNGKLDEVMIYNRALSAAEVSGIYNNSAPPITSNSPINGAIDVPVNSPVSITFGKTMNTASVEGAFSISPSVTGSFSWNGNILVFTPASALQLSTQYTVTLDVGAEDLAGNPLASPYSFSFTTISRPVITVVSPDNGAVDVPVNSHINITFSKTMNHTSAEGAFLIAPAVSGSFSWSGNTLVFTPSGALPLSTQYTVTMGVGAADLEGNQLASPYSFSFVTVPYYPVPPDANIFFNALYSDGNNASLYLVYNAFLGDIHLGSLTMLPNVPVTLNSRRQWIRANQSPLADLVNSSYGGDQEGVIIWLKLKDGSNAGINVEGVWNTIINNPVYKRYFGIDYGWTTKFHTFGNYELPGTRDYSIEFINICYTTWGLNAAFATYDAMYNLESSITSLGLSGAFQTVYGMEVMDPAAFGILKEIVTSPGYDRNIFLAMLQLEKAIQEQGIDLALLYPAGMDLNTLFTIVTQPGYDQNTYIDTLVHTCAYLQALQGNGGAGIAALNSLTGHDLPFNGPIANCNELQWFFAQMFDTGNRTVAYNDPVRAADAVVHAYAYLQALQGNGGAGITALNALMGHDLPVNGPITNGNELQWFFTQMYYFDQTRTEAYTDPSGAVSTILHAYAYLQALQSNGGAGITVLNGLTGHNLPLNGPITDNAELVWFFTQLFNEAGTHKQAWMDPAGEVTRLEHARYYLDALRNTSGALGAINYMLGQTIPSSGALTDGQVEFLFTQFIDEAGAYTQAWTDPAAESLNLVRAKDYLDILRNTSGALEKLYSMTGINIPVSGVLTASQVRSLFTHAPIANAGPDQIKEAQGLLTTVKLDGSGSYEPNPNDAIVIYTWRSGNGDVVATGMTPEIQIGRGTHTLTLIANDGDWDSKVVDNGSGNDSVVVINVVDTTPPAINVSAEIVMEATGINTPLIIPVTVTDACDPAPVLTSTALDSYPLGETMVVFTATDASGNSAVVVTRVIIRDTTQPVISVNGVENGRYYNADVTPVITFTDLFPGSLTLKLNGADYVSGTVIAGEGNYTLNATALDTSSNAAEENIAFTIDKTKPVITVTGVTEGAVYQNSVTPVVSVSDINLDTSLTVIRLNGADYASGTPVTTEGAYTLYVKAADKSGNITENTVHFSVMKEQAPVAYDINRKIFEDRYARIKLKATSKRHHARLKYYIVDKPLHGKVVLIGDRAFYKPDKDFNGVDQFTYKANDGKLDSNVATVTITVLSRNDRPRTENGNSVVNEDETVSIELEAVDPEDDPLTYYITIKPRHGKVTVSGNVAIYTPDEGYSGTDRFVFKANDGYADSEGTVVTIIVKPVNNAPNAYDVNDNVNKNHAEKIKLKATDADGDRLQYRIVSGPSHGTTVIQGDDVVYMPANGYTGTDSFTYKANDGKLDSNVATVVVKVK